METHHRSRPIRADHIPSSDDIPRFKCDLQLATVSTLEPDSFLAAHNRNTKLLQAGFENLLGFALRYQQNIGVSCVRCKTRKVRAHKSGGTIGEAQPFTLDPNVDQIVCTVNQIEGLGEIQYINKRKLGVLTSRVAAWRVMAREAGGLTTTSSTMMKS